MVAESDPAGLRCGAVAGSGTDSAGGDAEASAAAAGSTKPDIARGGLLAMGGSMYAGAAGFALTLVIGHRFGAHAAGLFFEAVSIFTILNGIAVLGSDIGLLRVIAGRRPQHAHDDVWSAIRLSALPVFCWSVVLGGVLWLTAGPIAERLLAEDADVLGGHLHWVAVTLVFSAVGQAALWGSRGFGDLRPYVLLYQMGLSTARVALIASLPFAWRSSLVAAWALPLVVMDLLVIGYVVKRATRERGSCPRPKAGTSPGFLSRELWRFNLPRGLASFFETCIVWSDVLVVGYFLGPAMAGAYAAASRFITTGTMAMEAMRVGSSPIIAAAYAQRDTRRANEAYQFSSIWLVLLSWPLFLVLAAFAPLVLGWVGDDFVVAAGAMTVMSLGILAYLVMGNINSVVLMAGRSDVTATNTFVAVLVNIGLNLLLVPWLGLVGAALSWSVSLALDSALCLLRGRRHTGAVLPVRGLLIAGGVCLLAFGPTGLLVRLVGDQEPGWLIVHLTLSLLAYAALLRRYRSPLHLEGLFSMLGRQR